MNDILKKRISIGVAVCCLSLAIGITIKNNFSSGSGGSAGPVQMLCTNSKCGQAFELSEKEFGDMVNQSRDGNTMLETPVFKCPKCNQRSAYTAIKCKKCGNVFVPNYKSSDVFDKCPKCGFSEFQDQK